MGNIFNEDFRDFISALNNNDVDYILVGGYSVILHGYSRTTGDLDVWVNKEKKNYAKLVKAFTEFEMPVFNMTEDTFLNNPELNVFTFGRPPRSIDIMTNVKGLDFGETFKDSKIVTVENLKVRLIHLNQLLQAKKASGRHKDLDDIENLS
jgi:predicted nucleotidyltransferase